MIQKALYAVNLQDFNKYNSVAPSEVHVTALTMCPLKWFYRLEYPDLARAQQYQAYMILGKLVHIGLQHLVKRLVVEGGLHGVKRVWCEVEAAKKVNLERNGLPTFITVKGSADIVLETVDRGRIVVEVKTARGDYHMPSEHHVLQLRTYMNLLGVGRGLLVYITPDRIAEYHVDEALSDFDLQKLLAEFFNREAPKYPWECGYCPYSILCPRKVQNNQRYQRRVG